MTNADSRLALTSAWKDKHGTIRIETKEAKAQLHKDILSLVGEDESEELELVFEHARNKYRAELRERLSKYFGGE